MSVIEKFAKKPENPFIETPSGDVETSLVLENLEKSFGYVQAVKNLNLTLYKNEIVVLLGFTGSGKTTTISLITGKYVVYRDYILLTYVLINHCCKEKIFTIIFHIFIRILNIYDIIFLFNYKIHLIFCVKIIVSLFCTETVNGSCQTTWSGY